MMSQALPESARKKIFPILAAVNCLILVLVLGSQQDLYRTYWRLSKVGQTTTGQVTKCATQKGHDVRSDTTWIDYNFEANSKTYQGYYPARRALPVGSNLTVTYDPQDPTCNTGRVLTDWRTELLRTALMVIVVMAALTGFYKLITPSIRAR